MPDDRVKRYCIHSVTATISGHHQPGTATMHYKLKPLVSFTVIFSILLNSICTDNKNNPATVQPPVVETTTVSGNVSGTFGGTALSIHSVYSPQVEITEDGDFNVAVSLEGAQLLCLTDSENKIWGMTVSIPEDTSARVLTVNDTSTALGMLFMSPGIASVDGDTVRSRITRLKATTGFAELTSFLASSLSTYPLSDILNGTAGDALRDQVDSLTLRILEEYAGISLSETLAKYSVTPSMRHLSVTIASDANPEKAPVRIANQAFRFLKVYRKANSLIKQFDMDGAAAVSFGSVLTASMARAATYVDTVSFSATPAVDYYFFGPGRSSTDYTEFPSDIRAKMAEEDLNSFYFYSFMTYMFFPLIEMFTGVSTVAGKTVETASNIATTLIQLPNGKAILDQMTSLFTKSSPREFMRAAVDVSAALMGLGLASGVFVTAGLMTAVTAEALGAVFVAGGLSMGAMNFLISSVFYFSVPSQTTIHATYIDTTRKQDLTTLGVALINKTEYTDPDNPIYKAIFGEFENRSDQSFTDIELTIEYLDNSESVAETDDFIAVHKIFMPGYRTPFRFDAFDENKDRNYRLSILGRPTGNVVDTNELTVISSRLTMEHQAHAVSGKYAEWPSVYTVINGPGVSLNSKLISSVTSYDEFGNMLWYNPTRGYSGGTTTGPVSFTASIALSDTGDFSLVIQSYYWTGDKAYTTRLNRSGKFSVVARPAGTYLSDRFADQKQRTVFYGKLINTGTIPVYDMQYSSGVKCSHYFLAPGDSTWYWSSLLEKEMDRRNDRVSFVEFTDASVPKEAIDVVVSRDSEDRRKWEVVVTNNHTTTIRLYTASFWIYPDKSVWIDGYGSRYNATLESGGSKEFSVTNSDTLQQYGFVAQGVEYTDP